MADPPLRSFLEAFLEQEAAPTVSGVPGEQLAGYRHALIERFANPALRDTLARLRVDASDRIPKFLLPLVRERLARGDDIRRSAAIVASWARCCGGGDEAGRTIAVVDRRRDSLVRAARRSGDLHGFVTDRSLFAELADDARFLDAYAEALSSLHARGARATLASLACA